MRPSIMMDGHYYAGKDGSVRKLLRVEFIPYKEDVATYLMIPQIMLGERTCLFRTLANWAKEDLGTIDDCPKCGCSPISKAMYIGPDGYNYHIQCQCGKLGPLRNIILGT
jgi:hypothetical protein